MNSTEMYNSTVRRYSLTGSRALLPHGAVKTATFVEFLVPAVNTEKHSKLSLLFKAILLFTHGERRPNIMKTFSFILSYKTNHALTRHNNEKHKITKHKYILNNTLDIRYNLLGYS